MTGRRSLAWVRFLRDEGGAALVEMTLLTPFMLALAAGVFEFSNIVHTKLLLEAGVRDAALYIARCGADLETCEAKAFELAVTAAAAGDYTRVEGWTVEQLTPSYTDFAATDPDTGLQNYRSADANLTTVEVSTSYPYPGSGLWTFLGFGALTLTAAHEERMLGS